MQAGVHLVVLSATLTDLQRSDDSGEQDRRPRAKCRPNSTTAPPVMDAPTALAVEVAGSVMDLSLHHVAERLDVGDAARLDLSPRADPQSGSPVRFARRDCLGQRDHPSVMPPALRGRCTGPGRKTWHFVARIPSSQERGMMRGLPANCLLCAEGPTPVNVVPAGQHLRPLVNVWLPPVSGSMAAASAFADGEARLEHATLAA